MAQQTMIDVRFNELDPYGHVNHAVYATYNEIGRIDALEAHGADLAALASEGIHLVVTGLSMKFHTPAVAGDRLMVETWLPVLRKASGTWSQRIVRLGETEPEVLLTAEVGACITNRLGRPTRPTEELRLVFEALTEPPSN